MVPHFTYCLLVWGAKIFQDHPVHLLQKRALRIVTHNDYIAHSEPICKELRLVKVPDLYRLSVWKFYYKLMNNKLPPYFESMKPQLPEVCNTHYIRRPTFHLPNITHEFAEHMLRFQLIKILNDENGSLMIIEKVFTHSFQGFKLYIKNNLIDSYSDQCYIINCEACERMSLR